MVFCAAVGVLYLYFFQEVLPFTISLILAYSLSPLMERGQRFLPSRTVRALSVIVGLFLLCWIVFSLILPSLEQELFKLIARAPSAFAYLSLPENPVWNDWADKLPGGVGKFLSEERRLASQHFLEKLPQIFSSVVSGGVALAGLVSTLCLIPILLFYFLRDWPQIVGKTESLLPHPMRTVVQELRPRVRYRLGRYVHGQFLIALILSGYYSSGFFVIGIDSPVLLGVIAGFLSFVPLVGALVLFLLTLLICTAQYASLGKAIGLAGLFLSAQLLETHYLYPRFIGKKAGLHPVWVLLALLAGFRWGGALGVIFAIPTASALSAVLIYAQERLLTSALFREPS
ncbi:MAG: AI-2E family transporter [Holosporales bacterium]|nr:AI-2E family transporter [Holosporales bacterium]